MSWRGPGKDGFPKKYCVYLIFIFLPNSGLAGEAALFWPGWVNPTGGEGRVARDEDEDENEEEDEEEGLFPDFFEVSGGVALRLRAGLRPIEPIEREVERGAFVHLGFGPDMAAVAFDDALDDGKADAGALEFLGAMQALEHAE